MKFIIALIITIGVLVGYKAAHAQSSVPDVVAPDCSNVTVTDMANQQATYLKDDINQKIKMAQIDENVHRQAIVQDDYILALFTPPQQEIAACIANLNATVNSTTSN